MSLGKRLRKEREKKGLAQNQVADLINVSNQVMSNYERDLRDPSTFTLKRIAELYNVSADYLLGITDDPRPLTKKELEFLNIIKDPDLRIWWEDLPKSDADKLKMLREMWNILNKDK